MPSPNIAVYQYSNIGPTLVGAKSDTVNFVADSANNPKAYPYCFVCVLTAGTFVVVDLNGNVQTFGALVAGQIIPFPVLRVNSTGTSGTHACMIPVQY